MKKIMGVLLLMVLVLTMVACSSKDDLLGKWNLNEAEAMGIEIIMTISDDQIEVMGVSYDYTIKGDKIVIMDEGVEASVNFNVDGDTLTFGSGEEEQTYIRIEE